MTSPAALPLDVLYRPCTLEGGVTREQRRQAEARKA